MSNFGYEPWKLSLAVNVNNFPDRRYSHFAKKKKGKQIVKKNKKKRRKTTQRKNKKERKPLNKPALLRKFTLLLKRCF